MSREREFHELIEEQNREEKDAVWAKIQQKDEPIPASPKSRSFSWRKWTPILASSLAAVVIGVFATWSFLSLNDGPNKGNKGRYFTSQSYEIVDPQCTLKEYAQKIGKNLLYFDWYAESYDLKDKAWQLKDTKEIICFQEDLIDIHSGCMIYIYVMEIGTGIEGFSLFEETNLENEIKGVQVDWKKASFTAYANFVYEDYKYYLRVDDSIEDNYILDLIEELLP